MKLSVFYDHVINASRQSGVPLDEVLCQIRSAGIQAVELDLFHFSEELDHLSLLTSAGLSIGCINGFYSMDESFDEEKANAHIAAAVKSGTDKILVVPGFLSDEDGARMKEVIHHREKTAKFLEHCEKALRIADGLSRITEMGANCGIQVTVEDFDNPRSPLSGLNSLLWYFERIPHLKCTFDTGNFITHGEDMPSAWELLKDHVVHVHCKDRSDIPVAVGDGYLPIAEIIRRIASTDYKGFFAIEHYDAADQLTCIKRSASCLRQLLSE